MFGKLNGSGGLEEQEPEVKDEVFTWIKGGIISTEAVSAKMAKQGGRRGGQ